MVVQILFSNVQWHIVKGRFVSGTLRPFFQTHLLSCVWLQLHFHCMLLWGDSLLNTQLIESLNFGILNVECSIMYVHNWKIFYWTEQHSKLMCMSDISVAKSVGWVWTIIFYDECHYQCSEPPLKICSMLAVVLIINGRHVFWAVFKLRLSIICTRV